METFRERENVERCPITLFVYATMNGYKAPICAEELGIPYNYVVIDFEKGQQRSAEYLLINPKGQIPALYDSDEDLTLAESAAILEYLATKYRDRAPRLFPAAVRDHWAVRQWVLFGATGLAPAMGNVRSLWMHRFIILTPFSAPLTLILFAQAMFFNRIAKTKGEDNEFSIQRYTNQSRGLLQVLDHQLKHSGGPFLLGEHITIADINAFTYASTHFWAVVSIDGLDSLKGWIDLLMKRDSVRKGLRIPFARPGFFGRPYATDAEIAEEIRRNAGMFTKGGDTSSNKK